MGHLMNSYLEVLAIVEGPTEKQFTREILAPYLLNKKIVFNPVVISKPGQKGGDVRFKRALRDIEHLLRQRKTTYISLFVDYYGIGRDWPGLDLVKSQSVPKLIAKNLMEATKNIVNEKFEEYNSKIRFIPNFTVHEFEALLFSDAKILSKHLFVPEDKILEILKKCGEPEKINNSSQTAPSKRLELLFERYKKTTTGITIAKEIGIEKIRAKCPVFNDWLTIIENLKEITNE